MPKQSLTVLHNIDVVLLIHSYIITRDCHAEPVLNKILRSLLSLRMTSSEGLTMTYRLVVPPVMNIW